MIEKKWELTKQKLAGFCSQEFMVFHLYFYSISLATQDIYVWDSWINECAKV